MYWTYNNDKQNDPIAAAYNNKIAETNSGCAGANPGAQLIETFALMWINGNIIHSMRATVCIIMLF